MNTLEIPIFPLNTVLFPGGVLPLRIFEQRYLEMTKECLRDNRSFGVFLISEGHEVGAPAVCADVGCLAAITDWEMPQLGIFHLLTQGQSKARILQRRVEKNGLMRGEVVLDEEKSIPIAPRFQRCAEMLRKIIEKTGEQHFLQPFHYEDALWVSYRLAEILPMELAARQRLLELRDAEERLEILSQLLQQSPLEN